MAEKLSIYNYKKGFLRIWIILSVIWMVLIYSSLDLYDETLSIIDTTNYCSSDSYSQKKLELESTSKKLEIALNDPIFIESPIPLKLANERDRHLQNLSEFNFFVLKCKVIKTSTKNLLEQYALILIAPVVLWFVLLITINLTRRLFLWVKSGFKGE